MSVKVTPTPLTKKQAQDPRSARLVLPEFFSNLLGTVCHGEAVGADLFRWQPLGDGPLVLTTSTPFSPWFTWTAVCCLHPKSPH